MCILKSGIITPGFWNAKVRSSNNEVAIRVLDSKSCQLVEKNKDNKWVYDPNIYPLKAFCDFKPLHTED